MKEGKVVLGIILIVCGTILFEMKYDFLSICCGLILLGGGIFLYLFAVDSLEVSRKKNRKTSSNTPEIFS
jgi:small neutral amino acid transporter SnatA (MarC family)